MTNENFVTLCKRIVTDYTNAQLEKICSRMIIPNNVYVVWLCKTLQNHKALLSTTISDGMYYEITYNGDKDELYFDAYKKLENRCINPNTLQIISRHDGSFDAKENRIIDENNKHVEEINGSECFHCGGDSVTWDADFEFEDFGLEGKGIVQTCHCNNCGAEIWYLISCDDDSEEGEDNGEH
jgi:hypothetical protein